MVSHATDWMFDWDTTEIDPNGEIRDGGKQLTYEIGLTLVNCESFLIAEDKLFLTELMDVINASIDNNINYGSPCDPFCESGPRIVFR